MDKLKPCSFCGSSNLTVDVTDADWYYVACENCSACGVTDLGESGAVESWNTRPLEDALLEACKAALPFVKMFAFKEEYGPVDELYEQLEASIARAEGGAA